MKTKLALVCLFLVAANSHALVYLEGEDDLGNIDEEIAQVWQEASGAYNEQPKRTAQNKPRPQYPVQETEQDDLDMFA